MYQENFTINNSIHNYDDIVINKNTYDSNNITQNIELEKLDALKNKINELTNKIDFAIKNTLNLNSQNKVQLMTLKIDEVINLLNSSIVSVGKIWPRRSETTDNCKHFSEGSKNINIEYEFINNNFE